jgi:FHS family Na+ dependent glucose MFS transporter 1
MTKSVSVQENARWFNTVAYYMSFILLGMGNATTGPVLVDLAAQTGAELSQISVIFTTAALGYFVGSTFGGRLYDERPAHRLMAFVLFFSAGVTALVPLVTDLWLLSGLFFLFSVTAGAVDVGGNTLLVWVHRDKVGPFMNGLHFAFGVGATLAPLLIVPIVKWSGGIAWVYWMLAMLNLPVALLLFRLPSPPSTAEDEVAGGKQVDSLLVVLIAAFLFLYVGAEMGFGNWIATYAQAIELADAATAAYLTSAFWGVFTAGRLLAIPIATIWQPRRILWVNLIGALASLGLIVLLPGATWALWGGAMGLGLFLASTFPTMFSLAERHLPVSGKLTSTFFMGISLGGMTLPWLIGQLFDAVGPRSVMWVILFDVILAIGLFVALVTHTERREQSQ